MIPSSRHPSEMSRKEREMLNWTTCITASLLLTAPCMKHKLMVLLFRLSKPCCVVIVLNVGCEFRVIGVRKTESSWPGLADSRLAHTDKSVLCILTQSAVTTVCRKSQGVGWPKFNCLVLVHFSSVVCQSVSLYVCLSVYLVSLESGWRIWGDALWFIRTDKARASPRRNSGTPHAAVTLRQCLASLSLTACAIAKTLNRKVLSVSQSFTLHTFTVLQAKQRDYQHRNAISWFRHTAVALRFPNGILVVWKRHHLTTAHDCESCSHSTS